MPWWENQFLSARNNVLFLEGRSAVELAREYGTPLFVYSKKQLRENYRELRHLLQRHSTRESRICYAMKSNSHPELLSALLEEGAWIDAVSPGEVAIARNSGFPAGRILFTSTSLSMEDLEKVLCHNDVLVNIDAPAQLDLMHAARERWFKHKSVRVAVRMNPGVGKGFNPKVTTSGATAEDGTPIKFGIEPDLIPAAFHRAADLGFNPIGLHQHLGSGWNDRDLDTVKQAVDVMVSMASELQAQGFSLEFLDFGGGFSPRYTDAQRPFPLNDYIAHIHLAVQAARLNIKAVALEPGKYLVGNAGVLLMRVEYTKKSFGNLFACVNAGTFNSVPRPAIYTEARHTVIHCSRIRSEDCQPFTIAGNLCETGDVFATDTLLPVPERGDILAFHCAGAYGRSMASTYNARPIPKEVVL
jgi:diaminopimelate decarboxylase